MGEKKRHTKEGRVEILRISEQEGIKKVSERPGIPSTTIYTWKNRYSETGEEALGKKRGGHNKGERRVEHWKIKEVLVEKEESRGSGPSQIRNQL